MQTQVISRIGRIILNLTIVSASVVALAGCASHPYRKSDNASLSIHQTAVAVQDEGRSLDATMAALKDLTAATQGDLKPKFQHFSTSLDATIASCKRAEDAARTMQSKSATYFAAWSKELPQMNYQVIRDSSTARKDEVKARFDAVNRHFQDTQAVVRPLVAYLQDIRTSLSTDLTMGGLKSITSVVAKADENNSKVQAGLNQLATDLMDSGSQMSSLALEQPQQTAAVTQQQTSALPQSSAATQQTATTTEQTAAVTQPSTAAQQTGTNTQQTDAASAQQAQPPSPTPPAPTEPQPQPH